MNVSLITLDSGILNKYGLSYNEDIVLNKNSKSNSYYSTNTGDIEDIVLNVTLVDSNYNPISWDESMLSNIMNWLITDNFKPFISEDNLDLIYYLKAKNIVKYFNANKEGYLEVTFQPFSNYAYRKLLRSFEVNEQFTVDIHNYSSLDGVYYPIIELENISQEPVNISILNTSLNKEAFTFNNLEPNNAIVIDNLIGTIYDISNKNRLMDSNRKWFGLKKQNNKVLFTGNVKVKIKAQFPMRS